MRRRRESIAARSAFDPVRFGACVKGQRTALGLTLFELSRKSRLSQPMLSQVEHGKRSLQAEHWPALAIALRMPVAALVEWAGACRACCGTGRAVTKEA
jgi:transcriptional regulator with XRE-family HTH domain